MIGWREARQRVERPELTSDQALRELRRVLTSTMPRLEVRAGKLHYRRTRGDWWWQVTASGERLDCGVAPTHAEALAVGLAALETASAVHA